METMTHFYAGVFPVFLALACVFWGPNIGEFFPRFSSSTKEDSTPTTANNILKGHMEKFGNQAEKIYDIITLDYFPDPEVFYRDYVRKSVPLVVKGALKHWPAVQKWKNEDYLRERFGDSVFMVNMKNITDAYHSYTMPMSMTDFLDDFKKRKVYMDSLISEKMAEDLTLPDFVACGEYMEMLKMIAIFFNSGWSRSDIHFDVSETIFAQVTGGRQWLLTTPTDGKYLYSDEFPNHSGTSPVNWEAIDLVKYPDVSKIAIYNATLDVGDVIYVPEGWWHQAKVTGGIPNIAIAVFIDFLHCLKNAPPSNDSVFIDNCIKLREDKPREMKCNMPLNGMTVKEVYDNYSHLKPQAMKFTIPEFRKDIFEYQPLKSGYSMPTLGLGLGGMSPEEANRSIRHAMRHGYRFFDTDSEDETEATLGYIMGDNPYCKREDVFVIAKVHPKNLGRNATKSSVERSMKRLNTDYIDLILIKAPSCDKEMIDCKAAENPGTWQESWQALEDMSKAGSIRSLGVSNFNILQMEELLTITTVPVSALQARFDLMKRNTKLREFCNKNGIRFIAHSLLGFKWAKSSSKTNPILHSQMVGFAARFYRTGPASVLIRYALEKNITVVPKSSNRLHIVLNKNSLIMNLRESKDAFDALDNFPHIP